MEVISVSSWERFRFHHFTGKSFFESVLLNMKVGILLQELGPGDQ